MAPTNARPDLVGICHSNCYLGVQFSLPHHPLLSTMFAWKPAAGSHAVPRPPLAPQRAAHLTAYLFLAAHTTMANPKQEWDQHVAREVRSTHLRTYVLAALAQRSLAACVPCNASSFVQHYRHKKIILHSYITHVVLHIHEASLCRSLFWDACVAQLVAVTISCPLIYCVISPFVSDSISVSHCRAP